MQTAATKFGFKEELNGELFDSILLGLEIGAVLRYKTLPNSYCYDCAEKYGLEKWATGCKPGICAICHQPNNYCCSGKNSNFLKGGILYANGRLQFIRTAFCQQYLKGLVTMIFSIQEDLIVSDQRKCTQQNKCVQASVCKLLNGHNGHFL